MGNGTPALRRSERITPKPFMNLPTPVTPDKRGRKHVRKRALRTSQDLTKMINQEVEGEEQGLQSLRGHTVTGARGFGLGAPLDLVTRGSRVLETLEVHIQKRVDSTIKMLDEARTVEEVIEKLNEEDAFFGQGSKILPKQATKIIIKLESNIIVLKYIREQGITIAE